MDDEHREPTEGHPSRPAIEIDLDHADALGAIDNQVVAAGFKCQEGSFEGFFDPCGQPLVVDRAFVKWPLGKGEFIRATPAREAADDLLAACRAARSILGCPYHIGASGTGCLRCEVIRTLDAAIAKAEGGKPDA
jgi:hypothetical protein